MKIVPLFYNNEIPGATPNIIQNRTVETFSAELFRKKLEFSDIFNQDSPARFMKINTDLLEEEGIFKNDIAVVDPLEEVVNGKIVVARVDNSLMIRRYEKIKSGLMLYGDTKKISPLKIEEGYDQFKILGVVAYVIKNF